MDLMTLAFNSWMKTSKFFVLGLRYNLNIKMQHSELTCLFGANSNWVIPAHFSYKVQASGHFSGKVKVSLMLVED